MSIDPGQLVLTPEEQLLLKVLAAHKVIPLDEAARQSGLSPSQILDFAARYPNLILFFGGDCPVVCQAVE
jgi:hypothetical protein